GSARLDGTPGSYEIPEGVDVRAIAHATLRPDRPAEPATLLVRRGAGHMLRRHAAQIEQVDADWERLHLPTPPADLADEVLGHGADVIVESPATLRASVIARLQGVLA
ncbi:MAG: WCX domain-containing protein, partial [Nocardioides sp.]